MKILVFNPEHDLCMAALKANYTPPASARQFAEECCGLMQYLGDEGDICVPASRVGEALRQHPEAEAIVPWGWNEVLRQQLLRQSVPERLLIDPMTQSMIRSQSDRIQTAIKYGAICHGIDPKWLGECPDRSVSVASLQRRLSAAGRPLVLKDPISGSGRGIHYADKELREKEVAWAERVLRQRRYLMVEPYYNVVEQMAVLFQIGDQGVRLLGYSSFGTKGFVYTHNYLHTDLFIRQNIDFYLPLEVFDQAIRNHEEELSMLSFLGYEGPVGVDMFIFRREDGSYGINPCCEFNYRYTMGFVAHELLRKHPEHHGKRFQINTPTPNNPHYSYSIA